MGICVCVNPRPGGCHACNPMGTTFSSPPQFGWQCPRCDSVMSPSMPTCWYCKPKENRHVFPPELTPTPRNETLALCPHGTPVKFNSCALCNQIPCGQFDIRECDHDWEYRGGYLQINAKHCKKCGKIEAVHP